MKTKEDNPRNLLYVSIEGQIQVKNSSEVHCRIIRCGSDGNQGTSMAGQSIPESICEKTTHQSCQSFVARNSTSPRSFCLCSPAN